MSGKDSHGNRARWASKTWAKVLLRGRERGEMKHDARILGGENFVERILKPYLFRLSPVLLRFNSFKPY